METKKKTLARLHAASYHADLDEIVLDQGRELKRIVIRHPSAVSIIPLIRENEALTVRQYRYPLAGETVEFPAGKLESGEKPEDAALRELIEETGYQAGTWKKLITFAPACGYSDELIHVFIATDLTRLEEVPEAGEISTVEAIHLDRMKAMILDGRIVDGTTIVSLAAYDWTVGIGHGESEP